MTATRAAALVSVATIVLTVIAGALIWIVDRDEFTSLGTGMWWALQTLTTVGYGDLVPSTTAGRLIGTVVMLNGVAFLTVVVAAVTALLVERIRGGGRLDRPENLETALAEIGARLDAIEDKLDGKGPDPGR